MTERILIDPDDQISLVSAAKRLGVSLAKLEQAVADALVKAARSLRPTAEALKAALEELKPYFEKEKTEKQEEPVCFPVNTSSMRPVPRRRGRPRQLASSYG